jgi:hypothetical protein
LQAQAIVCACWHETCNADSKNQAEGRFKMRPEKERTISFRITEEEWNDVEKRAATVRESPHQWARSAMLEKLHGNDELTRGDRFLFHHLVRAQYLLTQGFQMLADNNLTSEDWKKLRANAKQRVSELAENALARYAERNARRP